MKIKVISVGKPKDDGGFKDMDKFYSSRISVHNKIETVELKDKKSIEEEAVLIKKHILSNAFVVALRQDGEKFNSIEFSKLLNKVKDSSKNIVFVIGGAYGLGDIKENVSISIAPWTLPHQLARIVLLEQIYRGFSILSGSKYHHE